MKVKAWNNGKHHTSGAGYGFKLSIADRDRFFHREWNVVEIMLPNERQVCVNTDKPSFWGQPCRELINKEFGIWMIGCGYAPWPKGKPPEFELTHIEGNSFKLEE